MRFFWKRSRTSAGLARRNSSRRRIPPRIEELESRTLLSVAGLDDLWATPARFLAAPGPVGYTPAQVRQAYGFDRIGFGDGTIQGDGSGQTIAIVTAYDHPNLAADLERFNRTFDLPDVPQLTRVNQFGGTDYPRYDPQWALETALDVQWAHAIAPGANILVVEANSARLGNLLKAVDYARRQPGVVAVSMSWGASEFAQQSRFNRFFTTPTGHSDGAGLPGGITFIAASGDTGTLSWPATSANVLAVGGSRLVVHSGGVYRGETAWWGSGGGVSAYEPQPSYQAGFGTGQGRAVPDVSYSADPSAGFAVYATLPSFGEGWFEVGGTSAGAPQWAGLVAIAAQGRNLEGLPALGGIQRAIYGLADEAFHDILVGANAFLAGEGFDLVTGRGSPRAERVVAGLLGAADGEAPAELAMMPAAAAGDETDEPPPVDAGNLALILQTLSELPINSGQASGIPVTPQRLTEVPPPAPPPFVPPPPPQSSVIHNVGGGMQQLLEEELSREEKSDKPKPEKPAPAAPPEKVRPAAFLTPSEDTPAAQAEQLGLARFEQPQAAAGEVAENAGRGLFRWAAAAGLGLLLGGLWCGWAMHQRRRTRVRVEV